MRVSPDSVKLRVLVVDDEPLARSNLSVLLRPDPQIEVSECGSGAEAIAQIRAHRPDILFIDVQMPEVDGFDVLEMLGSDLPAAIIFVTAFDQYALRAFEAGALDYLLKPFDNARFERALSRAKKQVEAAAKPNRLERFAVKRAGEVLFLKPSEVDWIEAADYYACLHVGTKTHLLRRSMADLEHDLEPAIFCRVHRSSIVNLNRVRSVALSEEGEYEVILEDKTRLRLSRRLRAHLQERLGLRDGIDRSK
jgi:two-component system LytT family response regulator